MPRRATELEYGLVESHHAQRVRVSIVLGVGIDVLLIDVRQAILLPNWAVLLRFEKPQMLRRLDG
jgi:hypothetical protein